MSEVGTRPPITLNRSSPVPLYFQVAEQLERAIVDGTLAAGDRIDNEVALAQRLGLSRPTMRQAIQVLVDKGMLVRKRGVGTQVVHGMINRTVELTSLHDDLQAAGEEPATVVLALEQRPATDDVAEALHLAPGEPTWFLERLRSVRGGPLAIMQNHLPLDVIDLAAADLEADGLYAALRADGRQIRVARQRIGARRATGREARLLDESRNAPLLTMERIAYDDAGYVVELGRHAYRSESYAFELTLVDR